MGSVGGRAGLLSYIIGSGKAALEGTSEQGLK